MSDEQQHNVEADGHEIFRQMDVREMVHILWHDVETLQAQINELRERLAEKEAALN